MKMKHFNSLSKESISRNVCSGNPSLRTEKTATTVMHVAHSQQSEIQTEVCHHQRYLGKPSFPEDLSRKVSISLLPSPSMAWKNWQKHGKIYLSYNLWKDIFDLNKWEASKR